MHPFYSGVRWDSVMEGLVMLTLAPSCPYCTLACLQMTFPDFIFLACNMGRYHQEIPQIFSSKGNANEFCHHLVILKMGKLCGISQDCVYAWRCVVS